MKKVIALMLAVFMLLSMAACASKSESSTPSSDASASTTTSTETSSDSSAESTSDASVIKIGCPQPLTGTNALVGESAMRGAELAVAEINAAGGVLGHQLELVEYDDQGSPEEAVKLATKLIEVDKVNWMSGSLISSCMRAAGPYYEEAGIITMGTGTSSTWTNQGWKYVWRSSPNAGSVMPAMAQYMKNLGINSISIFQGQDDASASGAEDMRKAAKDAGIEVITSETYVDGDTDFSGQAIKIVNSGADAVFTSTYSVAQASFAKQLRQAGYKGIVFNKETLSVDNVAAAGDAANYYAFIWPYVTYASLDEISDSDVRMKEMCESYYKMFNEMPYHDCCYRSYDSIYILKAAAEAAGSIESDAMNEALATINNFDGLAGTYDFTQGDMGGIRDYTAWVIVDQKSTKFDEWLASGGYDALKAEIG